MYVCTLLKKNCGTVLQPTNLKTSVRALKLAKTSVTVLQPTKTSVLQPTKTSVQALKLAKTSGTVSQPTTLGSFLQVLVT